MVKKYYGYLLKIIFSIFTLFIFSCSPKQVQKESTKLWQLPEQTFSPNMSYVLITENRKVCVIDGGTEGDGEYLFRFLGSKNIDEVDE